MSTIFPRNRRFCDARGQTDISATTGPNIQRSDRRLVSALLGGRSPAMAATIKQGSVGSQGGDHHAILLAGGYGLHADGTRKSRIVEKKTHGGTPWARCRLRSAAKLPCVKAAHARRLCFSISRPSAATNTEDVSSMLRDNGLTTGPEIHSPQPLRSQREAVRVDAAVGVDLGHGIGDEEELLGGPRQPGHPHEIVTRS